jgi:hypothetical protein
VPSTSESATRSTHPSTSGKRRQLRHLKRPLHEAAFFIGFRETQFPKKRVAKTHLFAKSAKIAASYAEKFPLDVWFPSATLGAFRCGVTRWDELFFQAQKSRSVVVKDVAFLLLS